VDQALVLALEPAEAANSYEQESRPSLAQQAVSSYQPRENYGGSSTATLTKTRS
jgi:hypothetical protein